MFAETMGQITYRTYRLKLEALLQIPRSASNLEIHHLIEAGLPPRCLCTFYQSGAIGVLERDQIISHRRLKHKLAHGQHLSACESDRLFRMVHISALTEAIMGDVSKAKRWLSKPKARFAGKSAFAMLSTFQGVSQVEEMLMQVVEGIAF